MKREKVWLAVAGIVVSREGKWLVVKKKYGGLKGKWSFPAGFVEHGETLDEAVIREIYEETGITCEVLGVIGIRSGVIQSEISDNMVIFLLNAKTDEVTVQEKELSEATFLSPEQLKASADTSVLITYFIETGYTTLSQLKENINPGDQFGYTVYKLFH